MSNEEETVIDAVLDLALKLEGIDCILENAEKAEGQIALSVFGNLIEYIYILLWESIIINLQWMFEKPARKESRGLYWFINNKRKSDPENDKRAEWDTLEKELDWHLDVVKKVRLIRHKWLAHRDKKACKDPTQFIKEVKLDLADVRLLIDVALKIVTKDFPVRRLGQLDVHKLFWAVEFPEDFVEEVRELKVIVKSSK